jgi:hypothetical protein
LIFGTVSKLDKGQAIGAVSVARVPMIRDLEHFLLAVSQCTLAVASQISRSATY